MAQHALKLKNIEIVPQNWEANPANVRYHYIDTRNQTLWNVWAVSEHGICLWQENGLAQIVLGSVDVRKFKAQFARFTRPA